MNGIVLTLAPVAMQNAPLMSAMSGTSTQPTTLQRLLPRWGRHNQVIAAVDEWGLAVQKFEQSEIRIENFGMK
jgi:hypothetical protein